MRLRKYGFVIDNVRGSTLPRLYKALAEASQLTGMYFDDVSHVLRVEALGDPEKSIRIACESAGAAFRTRLR